MSTNKDDEIKLGPEIAPGVCVALRRSPSGEIREVACRLARDGTSSLGGELVYVSETSQDGWHKLTSVYKSGPAQVATPEYRSGYDRIFGKQKVGLA